MKLLNFLSESMTEHHHIPRQVTEARIKDIFRTPQAAMRRSTTRGQKTIFQQSQVAAIPESDKAGHSLQKS